MKGYNFTERAKRFSRWRGTRPVAFAMNTSVPSICCLA